MGDFGRKINATVKKVTDVRIGGTKEGKCGASISDLLLNNIQCFDVSLTYMLTMLKLNAHFVHANNIINDNN